MRVLSFIEAADHVCYRYRLQAFAGALAEAGWTLDAVPLAANSAERACQLWDARHADVVIVQRKLLRLWQLRLLRRWAKRLIYDFDDAVFIRDSFSRKATASWSRRSMFKEIVFAADAVIAGNDYLKSHALVHAGPDRVRVIPTCVDPRRYPAAVHKRTGSDAKLVWIGERSTVPTLTCARPLLAAVAGRLPDIQLSVISNAFPEDAEVRVIPRRWSTATETADLAAADIGIAWLPDDEWSRGKCGLKVLQYMAAGLPVVADPVGVHREIIVDGKTGYLATSAREWADAIERLARSPQLRQRMGNNARRRIIEHYSVSRWAPEFVRAVQGVDRTRGDADVAGLADLVSTDGWTSLAVEQGA